MKFKIYDEFNCVIADGNLKRIGIAGEAFAKVEGTKKAMLEKYIYANKLYSICTLIYGENTKEYHPIISNYKEGIKWIIDNIIKESIIKTCLEIDYVGFRIVSGGNIFNKTIELNEQNIEKIREISFLAPMHFISTLDALEEAKKFFHNSRFYGVFDNLFHNTIESEVYTYAIPKKWTDKYGIRKYGAHGLSYEYVASKCEKIISNKEKIIVCHLGQGSSICALKNLKSIDTSMGFTPIDGIPMGTRSGSIDPSIIDYISKKENKTMDEIFFCLNYKSGLYGISNRSSDIADLIDSDKPECILAINILVKRIIDYIGSYMIHLGGLDALIFTGGAGVNSYKLRKKIIDKLACCNVKIDEQLNENSVFEKNIALDSSSVGIYIIPSDEEYGIYKEFKNI